MKLPTYQWIGQIFAVVSVVISLGFVAYEMKLARDIAIAELTVSTQSAALEIKLALLRPEVYASARAKLISGSELSDEEISEYSTVIDLEMANMDSVHMLYTMGLLAEGEWLAYRRYLKFKIKNSYIFREAAKPENLATRPEMLAEIQGIWDEIDAETSKTK
jgi:hypothetical protein